MAMIERHRIIIPHRENAFFEHTGFYFCLFKEKLVHGQTVLVKAAFITPFYKLWTNAQIRDNLLQLLIAHWGVTAIISKAEPHAATVTMIFM